MRGTAFWSKRDQTSNLRRCHADPSPPIVTSALSALRDEVLTLVFGHRFAFRIAAIASWFGLVVFFVAPIRLAQLSWPSRWLGRAVAFFASALITRFSFLHVESRLQIATFCVVAAALEGLRTLLLDERFEVAAWAVASVGACIGVLVAKRVVEPGAISAGFGQLFGMH